MPIDRNKNKNFIIRRALFALLAGSFILLFLNLAYWQYLRAEQKQQMFDKFEAQTNTPLGIQDVNLDTPELSRIQINQTSWLPDRYYWDNRHHNGQVGYEQIALLQLPDETLLMVNLGWQLAPPTRQQLPDELDRPVTLDGRMRPLTPPLQLSDATDPDFRQRIQFPQAEQISSQLNRPVLPWMLELNSEWQPATMTPIKHMGYMWQWLALALACSLLTGFWLRTEYKAYKHDREHEQGGIVNDPEPKL